MITREIILQSFRTVRSNTIEVAKDIPEEKYDFRAAPETMTVLELFRNVIRATEFMTGIALYEGEIKITPETRAEWGKKLCPTDFESLKTKEEIIAALTSSYENIEKRVLAANLDFLNSTFVAPDKATKVRLWVVQCAKEQEMCTRATLFQIERMLGIVPHTTRRQQEREAKAKALQA